MGWNVLPKTRRNLHPAAAPVEKGKNVPRPQAAGHLGRYFDKPGLADKIRITVGTSQENNALLGGIRALNLSEKQAELAKRKEGI